MFLITDFLMITLISQIVLCISPVLSLNKFTVSGLVGARIPEGGVTTLFPQTAKKIFKYAHFNYFCWNLMAEWFSAMVN